MGVSVCRAKPFKNNAGQQNRVFPFVMKVFGAHRWSDLNSELYVPVLI